MLHYIVQGIIQGLTEFLPVSSSGHLTLYQYFSGSANPETNLLANIALHFGTLLAVIFYFRADLLPFLTIKGLKEPRQRKLALLVFVGSIPTAIIGLAFKKQFKALFQMPSLVAVALLATAILLLVAEKLKSASNNETIESFSPAKAAIIGLAQGMAITPGVSRSGSTIATGLILGLTGEEAARLSFLLMIPAVGGATLLEAKDLIKTGLPPTLDVAGLAAGTLAAAITGFFALKFLVYIVKKQKLSYFAYYLLIASIVSLVMINIAGN